jgi:hypothetical protein
MESFFWGGLGDTITFGFRIAGLNKIEQVMENHLLNKKSISQEYFPVLANRKSQNF